MNHRKGIILAGGSGSRLYPSTIATSKQLLPIYDKPLIYYPLSVLMLANIKEILLISSEDQIESYKRLLGNGANFGVSIEYCIQKAPNGLAEAFILGEQFLNNSPCALVLGDNIFYGMGFEKILNQAYSEQMATVFAQRVEDPERFGIVEFDKNFNVRSLEEKPLNPKSNFAVTGLYFYDERVCEYAKTLTPSERGELEITDLNKIYLKQNSLKVEIFSRGFAWLDTGTPDSLLSASQFVQTIEKRQGLKICSPEEISLGKGWIDKDILLHRIKNNKDSYSKYLIDLILNNEF